MKKKVGIIKRVLCIGLIFLLSINSFAAIVSDNDGSAFITKAEFDALKSSFQSQIDTYNQSIDSKIDGAIASYLAGIQIAKTTVVPNLLSQYRITGVTYDGGKLYWSATRNALNTANYSYLTWRASVAYGIANVTIATGSQITPAVIGRKFPRTGNTLDNENGQMRLWHRTSLHDFKSPQDQYTYIMDGTGKILRASNRQYCMNSSLIWQSIGRNNSSDIKETYPAGGTFNFDYWFRSDYKINRLTEPVWSKYRLGNTTMEIATSITYGYTSFTCEDNDLPDTVCCPVFASTTTSGTTYYADDITVDELDVAGATLYNIMALPDYTMSTPDYCEPMYRDASTNLSAPLKAYVTNHMKAIQPKDLIFDDFIKINSKNNTIIRNGVCLIDNVEKVGKLRFEFTASTAGKIYLFTGKTPVIDCTAYIDLVSDVAVVAGANVKELDLTEKDVWVAISFLPTSGNGKIDDMVVTLTAED